MAGKGKGKKPRKRMSQKEREKILTMAGYSPKSRKIIRKVRGGYSIR